MFIFRLFPTSGSRMLRLERLRAAGKDSLGAGLGTAPDPRVPGHRKSQSVQGAAKPPGDRDAGFSANLQF